MGLAGIWRFAEPLKRQLVVLLILGILSAIADGSVPYVTGKFFDALVAISEHQTTFIIAHRLPTVRKAGTILVFEKGRIVERGTHEELLNKDGGVYRHLYEYQIGLH